MSIFQYEFMQRAFFVGLFLAAIIPLIGTVVVFKRLAMIGDAISHVSLAGVACGLILGFNPVLGAVITSLIAAFSIEAVRKRFPQFSELSIGIILAVGVGLTGILSEQVRNASNFNSFLFGSIVAISDFELLLSLGVSLAVLIAYVLLYKELFYIAFDEQGARLAGIPVNLINAVFTVMTAVTISVAARTVGALIVSSLMIIPVAAAMQLAGSYRQTVLLSVLFGVGSMGLGLLLSFYLDWRPGGTIVLISVTWLLLIFFGKGLTGWMRSRRGRSYEQS